LNQNYPNPFNSDTSIKYSLKTVSDVQLTVYNVSGQVIKAYDLQDQNAGEHTITFSAADLASGMYVYKLNAGIFEQSHKMLLVR
jgi:flagellar hook assembly protein FlgD